MSADLERASAALEQPIQAIAAALATRPKEGESARRVLFASPRHGDGTTTVAACTAVALGMNLRIPVVLVEANPFRPALAAYAGCAPTPGFVDALHADPAHAPVLRECFVPGVSLLPAGQATSEPLAWRGTAARVLFGERLQGFPFALIDAPPLLDRPVGRLLLEFADLVVLVVRAGATTKSDARAAARVLAEAGVPVAGVVLNQFKKPLPFL